MLSVFLLIVANYIFAANVIFEVDMSYMNTSEDGVYIVGSDASFLGPEGVVMSDENGDDIWDIELELNPGSYTYKFRNGFCDNWDNCGNMWESIPDECGSQEFGDREITVDDDDVWAGPFCFSSCEACPEEVDYYNVTFSVDMQNVSTSEDGVYIVGSDPLLEGPTGHLMSDTDGDDVWEVTLELMPGTYTYKFRNGFCDNWDNCGDSWESISGFCATGSWNDRQLTVSNNNQVLDKVCFNSCTECDSGPEEYILVWSDEFNGNEIDLNKWTFEVGNGNWGWGNGEHQYYTSRSENAFIEDGNLVIQALYENYNGYNYTSARMKTVNQGDWVYGKIKARIKVPSANGTWPAFWMMPTNSVYGGWPHSGEIDIMEHYGCDNLENHPEATVHNSTYNWNGGIPPTSYEEFIATATSEFHDYELEWTESELKFSINGNWIGSYYNNNSGWQQWPYNQEFYIILNLAIGSHFMSCETENNLFPQRYEIDYVRVYQLQNTEYIDLYGDINLDGILNIIDVIMMVDFIIGNSIPTNFEFLILDINTDSNLDILDVIQLIELIL